MEDFKKKIDNLEKDIENLEKDVEDLEKEVMLNSRWRVIIQWLLAIGFSINIILILLSLQYIY